MTMAARRFTTEALVIRHMDYGEADRILTLFTPVHGKLHAIAKGVRRTNSRKAGHLELFSRSSVFVAQGRNLAVVSQAETIEHFDGLRRELAASGSAHYVCELIDSFVPDELTNASLYAESIGVLRSIASNASLMPVRAFELTLLEVCGYRPELHQCVGCGQPVEPGSNGFSVALGGILGPECLSQDPAAKPISTAGLKLMRNLQTDAPRVLRLESVDFRLVRETGARLQEYITYLLERRPNSVGVLERIERGLARPFASASPSPSG